MKLKFLPILIAAAGLAGPVAAPAQAGDEHAFEGLIPGFALKDAELEAIYGKGTALLINGELVNILGDIDLSQNANQVSSIIGNSGITTPIQFVGDENNVTVNVVLSVNIGTVTISNPVGSSINASSAVQFSGALDFGLGN